MRRWSAKGWGQAKGSDAKVGNFAVGIALGSGDQGQIFRMSNAERLVRANEMKASGVSWIRLDAEWWTVQRLGMVVSSTLTSGQSYSSFTVNATGGGIISIPAGSTLTISDLAGHLLSVVTTSSVVTSSSTSTVIPTQAFTPTSTFSAGSKLGQPFDWSTVDPIVDAFQSAGMNIVVLLNKAPGWALRPVNVTPLFSPRQTPEPSLYAVYCAEAARHFHTAYGVEVYELWNEPNLSTGTDVDGWGYLSVLGFIELAVAAYPAIKAVDPSMFVLSATVATASEFGQAGNSRTVSWSDVSAGATTVSVSCAEAVASEAYGFFSDAADGWPAGTVVQSATTGVGYVLRPPPWSTGGFPAISAKTGATAQVSNSQMAPDFWVARAYEVAAGRPWLDALAIHPYTQPLLPGAQLTQFGGWTVVPNMRATMIANGDGSKLIWMTEIGAPTGAASGCSWPSAASSATSLTVSGTQANPADTDYLITGTGLPAGAYVESAVLKSNWLVRPTTSIVLAQALTTGATTQITVKATSAALTIPSGTALTVLPPVSPSVNSTLRLAIVTTGDVVTSTGSQTVIPISSVSPLYAYPVDSRVDGSVGQTFGAAISAASGVTCSLAGPGVPTVFGMVDEAMQAQIIATAFLSISFGVAGTSGPGASAWPYIGPIFVYCWQDSNAGAFGLVRGDGTPKPALASMGNAIETGT
jgi:hypothetical protein